MDYLTKNHVTIGFATNANVNCYFFIHQMIHEAPARIMRKVTQYWVCMMFMLYIYGKPNGMGAAMFLMDI